MLRDRRWFKENFGADPSKLHLPYEEVDCSSKTGVKVFKKFWEESHVLPFKDDLKKAKFLQMLKSVSKNSLITGPKNRKYLSAKEASINALINRYKQVAKRKNLTWSLDRNSCIALFFSNCDYCGSSPKNKFNVYITNSGKARPGIQEWQESGWITFQGIDRVDNSKGYVLSNCISCCTICNYAKSNLSLEEFNIWLKRIATKNFTIEPYVIDTFEIKKEKQINLNYKASNQPKFTTRRGSNIIGRKYGMLTIVKKETKNNTWLCKCECGKEIYKTVKYLNACLKIKAQISCGCLKKIKREYDQSAELVSYFALINSYKNGAVYKYRNFKWELSDEQAIWILKQNCFYCGVLPEKEYSVYQDKNGKSKYHNPVDLDRSKASIIFYNGIDRIDPGDDYTETNVVPCCESCNKAKNDLSIKEFKNWVLGLVDYFQKIGSVNE